MCNVTIVDLPADVYLECFSYVDSEDLCALALTCQKFRPYAIRQLYESVLITKENVGQFLRTVTERKDCRPLVKSLALFIFEEPPEEIRHKLNARDRARIISQLQFELSPEELAFDYFQSIIQLVKYERDFVAMGSLILRLLPNLKWVNLGDDEYSYQMFTVGLVRYTKRSEFPWWVLPLRHGRYEHLSEIVINMHSVTDPNYLRFLPPTVKTLRLWNLFESHLKMVPHAHLKSVETLEIMPGCIDEQTATPLIKACGPLKKLSFGLRGGDYKIYSGPPMSTKNLWPAILEQRESLEEIALWHAFVRDWDEGYMVRPQSFARLKALTLPKAMLPPHWFESNLQEILPPSIEAFIVHGLGLEERDRIWSSHGILQQFIEAKRSNPETLPRLRYLGFAICDWQFNISNGFEYYSNEFFGPNVSERIENLYGDLLEAGVETSLWIGTRPEAIPHIWPRTSRWYVSQERRSEISQRNRKVLMEAKKRWGSGFRPGFVEDTKVYAKWESYRDEDYYGTRSSSLAFQDLDGREHDSDEETLYL